MQLQLRFSSELNRSLLLLLSLLLGLTLTARPAQAATISVTNSNDSGPGSLRQAIADAAPGDTVSFNLSGCPCTITLTSGELVIDKNLIIAGLGAQVLTVSGNNASRVFQVAAGTFEVTIANLTVANGRTRFEAGAIYVESNGTFNLINVAVMNSIATDYFATGGGLDFNSSAGGGTVTIVGSTFSGNSAFEGGAIHLEDGNVRISNTTIAGNTATGGLGGGISNWQSNLTIVNSTITGNSSTGTDVYGSAGGVVNIDIANITVANSIIAGNRGVNPDVGDEPDNTGRFVSLGHNLIGNNQGAETFFPAGIPNANGDLVGTSAAPIDPRLAALADNGGPTPTQALLAGSPAINAGNPAAPGSGSPACELTDQRGYARPDRCDIGAFELNGILTDSLPPTASPTQSPIANSNGWNNLDVTVTWNWSDSGTGIDSANCTTASTSSGEGTLTLRATCQDKGGNAGSAEYTVKVDKTAPTISAAATTAPNANGWYNSNVTVHFTCADALSGVTSCPADQVLSSEGAAVVSTAQTVTDLAGNPSALSNVVTVKIDKTAPTISAAVTTQPNANGWYNSNVIVHFTCTDALSGVTSCPADQVLSGDGATVVSTAQTVSDQAGNQSAPSNVVTVQLDKTAPVVAMTGVSNGATYPLGSVPAAGCTTSDATSGVATQATLSITGGNPDGSGSYTATCSGATDKAGNSAAPVSVIYTVAYRWTGFLQPVDNLPTVNTVNAGSSIPVKFSLSGNFGLNIFASGYPASQLVNCSTGSSTGPLTPITAPGNSGLQYDATTQTYTYVWKTDKAWAGTCRQLIVKLIDGTEHIALFQFNGNGNGRSAEAGESNEGEATVQQKIFLPLVNR